MGDDGQRGLDTTSVVHLTETTCPEGHAVEEQTPFCPVCLTPVSVHRALWSPNQPHGPSKK